MFTIWEAQFKTSSLGPSPSSCLTFRNKPEGPAQLPKKYIYYLRNDSPQSSCNRPLQLNSPPAVARLWCTPNGFICWGFHSQNGHVRGARTLKICRLQTSGMLSGHNSDMLGRDCGDLASDFVKQRDHFHACSHNDMAPAAIWNSPQSQWGSPISDFPSENYSLKFVYQVACLWYFFIVIWNWLTYHLNKMISNQPHVF